MKSIKASFNQKSLRGFVVTIPVVITISMAVKVFELLDGVLNPVLDDLTGRYNHGPGLPADLFVFIIVGLISTKIAMYLLANNLYPRYMVFFREDDVIETSRAIEEGIPIIVSGGVVLPGSLSGAVL